MKTISVYLGTGPGRLLLIIGNYQQLAEGWLSVNFCLHFVFPNRETVKRDKNILGHRENETVNILGHTDTKSVNILGHTDTEIVFSDKIRTNPNYW